MTPVRLRPPPPGPPPRPLRERVAVGMEALLVWLSGIPEVRAILREGLLQRKVCAVRVIATWAHSSQALFAG